MTICDTTCSADTPLLSPQDVMTRLEALPDWHLSDDGTSIRRDLLFKGFAKATYAANLAIWLADKTGHHPDIRLGWGYCTLIYTSHEAGGLTQADFACATRFNAILDAA